VKVLEATDFYYPWIAGPAPLIRNLSTGLVESGHEVVIACPSPTGGAFEEDGPPRTHRVRTAPLPFGYKLRGGAPLIDLSRFVSRWRPDVIHIHHPFLISLSALAAGRIQGVPVVATNHTIPECTLFGIRDSWMYGAARRTLAVHIRTVLGRAQAVATPTQTAAGLLRDMGFRGEVEVVSNGVDTARFHPAMAPEGGESGEPPGEPVVLYTGRLDDDKDMNTFIHAIPHVLARAKAIFRIGGEGTDRGRLERLVASLGLSHSVVFSGYVDEEALPHVYSAATIYAISSRVELQSITTLEAMASGLPVVAVDAGALPELVKSGINGELVAPGDSKAFGEAIADILVDHNKRRTMGRQSRMIAELHSVGAMVGQYERLFRRVTHEHASGPVYGAAGI
jgi:glycosyltransferase involved in cell wall biosynthesis